MCLALVEADRVKVGHYAKVIVSRNHFISDIAKYFTRASLSAANSTFDFGQKWALDMNTGFSKTLGIWPQRKRKRSFSIIEPLT
jgi:hypothetical protein